MTSCKECGSEKLIPNVPLQDHYGDLGGLSHQASLEVEANPKAWVFKGAVTGTLSAWICGECGYAELRVSNPQKLYAAYRRSLQE